MKQMSQICNGGHNNGPVNANAVNGEVASDKAEHRQADDYDSDSFGGVYLGPPEGNVSPKSEDGATKVEDTADDVVDNAFLQVHATEDKADLVPSKKAGLHHSVPLGSPNNDGEAPENEGGKGNVTSNVGGRDKVSHAEVKNGMVHVIVQVHVASDQEESREKC